MDSEYDFDSFKGLVYSPTGPAGWTVDRSQIPAGGVTEWRGWNWVDPVWWSEVAGQGRDLFASPDQGLVIAVADSDEWDDKGHDPGSMPTVMTTPSIPLTGIASGSRFEFDSSWLPEPNQYATLTAKFNVGAPVELFRWESTEFLEDGVTPNPKYQPAGNPERMSIPVNFPAGATSVKFDFGYEGNNNWWWAVDNLNFGNYAEDFEGVALGENVDEGRVQGSDLEFDPDHVFTHTPPAGWTIENDIPGFDDEAQGKEEWKGWSFTNKNFWDLVAGNQDRRLFTNGKGTVAVADPDEWDDTGHDPGTFNTWMTTPAINIQGAGANKVELNFDSSWRDECCDDNPDIPNDQTAVITATYDTGESFEVLRWQSDQASPFFKNDAQNENVTIQLKNPANAKTVKLTFGLLNSENDWWWAVDNLKVSGAAGGIVGDFNNNGQLDAADLDLLAGGMATNNAAFDLDGDSDADYSDRLKWVRDLKKTWIGDANLDGEFNSTDLVATFTVGKFETGAAAGWSEGDFDGNGKFETSDFVAAFTDGGYENGPRAAVAAVPEPASASLLVVGALGLFGLARRRR